MPAPPTCPYRPTCRFRKLQSDRRACRRGSRRRWQPPPGVRPLRYRRTPSTSSRARPWRAARRAAAWGGFPSESRQSCFGMRLIVDRHEVCERYLRIFLGGGEAGVTEQFLDRTQVRAVSQQVRGVRVPEAMGVHRRVAREVRGVQLYDAADPAGGEARIAVVEENGALV